MNFDLRFPLGLMFSIYGVVLVVLGLTTDKSIYDKSLQININLAWGAVMLVFGVVMLFFSLRTKKSSVTGDSDKNPRVTTKAVPSDKTSP